MDRLKQTTNSILEQVQMNLHSNMDRLKHDGGMLVAYEVERFTFQYG